ncbi:EamA family transporter [Streptococcus sp. X16XC17]|uniref:DMT family transporter n=1 Tax=unclassified Streptococcus TaxID=2608887 RepID=UPI000B12B6EE|nr:MULTISPECIES: DMT family transporter [unclassified Streptococcus]TCD45932.1 EamA family transporter [Streptococcus sp. X16XC17]
MITSLRLLISGVVLLGFAKRRVPENFRRLVKDKKSLVGVVVFGLLGLVLNQLAYLKAVGYTNAGTATVLQYLCPILVLAYTCLRARQRPTLVEVISILLAIGGTFLIATHGQVSDLAVTPIGLFWGIFSAFTYAIYIILPVQLIREYGSLLVMGFGMLAGGILLTLGFQTWQEPLILNADNLLGFIGIVGIGTIFAYTVFLEGVSLVGSVKGSLLASIEPIASVIFSVLLVHEIFYPLDLVGMVLILVAVLLISVKDMILQKKHQL